MTVEHRLRPESGVSCLLVFCETCGTKHTGGKHLAPPIHHGYGKSTEPLSEGEQEAMTRVAKTHDRQYPDHTIIMYHYTP